MADPKNVEAGDPASERRGSLLVDPRLTSEEDAAVLAKMGYVCSNSYCPRLTYCLADTSKSCAVISA
jgi:hypothetical protein